MKAIAIGVAATVLAWSAAAQDVTRQAVLLPDGRCMITAITPKTVQGTIVIPFGTTFKTAPIVMVSQVWIGGGSLSAPETVTAISIDQFSDTSTAAAGNYYVSWIAIGPARTKACK